jgi:hypothetical protein
MPRILLVYLSLLLVLGSCAPSRFVKPLAKKQQALNVSLGGPLIAFGDLTIPTPFLTAAYGYGVDSTLTAFGAVNLTSAYYGNLQLELGATKKLLAQRGLIPAVSVSPVLNIIYRNKDAINVLPQVDLNAYLELNKGRNLTYIGVSNWFELSSKRSTGEAQPTHWFISPQIGHALVRRKWELCLEAKVLAPHVSYESSAVDYKSPFGKHGAFGIYMGYTRKFNRE